jgi:hypothetical protein
MLLKITGYFLKIFELRKLSENQAHMFHCTLSSA